MKAFNTKILAIFSVIFLSAPAGVFAVSAPETNMPATPQNQAFIKIVTVVPPQVSTKVFGISKAESANCDVSSTGSDLLFAGTFNLNLNQPANCFKLVENNLVVSKTELVVAEVAPQPKIVVTYGQQFYHGQAFSTPFTQKTDAVQVSILLGLLVSYFASKRSVQYKKAKQPEAVVFSPSVFELLVLRC